MSGGQVAAAAALAVVAVTLLVIAVLWFRAWRTDIAWKVDWRFYRETRSLRWRVRTPVGRAVVTEVLDEAGQGHEIVTMFRGERRHREVQPPAILLTQKRVETLVEERRRRR